MITTTTIGTRHSLVPVLQNTQKDYTAEYIEGLQLGVITGLSICGLATVATNLCLIAWELMP